MSKSIVETDSLEETVKELDRMYPKQNDKLTFLHNGYFITVKFKISKDICHIHFIDFRTKGGGKAYALLGNIVDETMFIDTITENIDHSNIEYSDVVKRWFKKQGYTNPILVGE